MADHDPLCPWAHAAIQYATCRDCDLIAKVVQREYDLHASADLAREEDIRADERKRHGNNCRGMWDEWLLDLKDKVKALLGEWYEPVEDFVVIDAVIALIERESHQLGGDDA